MEMYAYLIHFKYKLHHAEHYIGFTKCLDFRIARHREGTGAKLIRAITRLGIPWIVIRTWQVDGQGFERYLKNQKHAARFFPGTDRAPRTARSCGAGGRCDRCSVVRLLQTRQTD